MKTSTHRWPSSTSKSPALATAQEIDLIRARLNERPLVLGQDAVAGVLLGRVNQVRRPVIDDLPCPLGEVGGRLWLKEAWQSKYTLDGGSLNDLVDWQKTPRDCLYEAQDPRQQLSGPEAQAIARWRDPLRMPRWASRINLEITSIEEEPLRAINDEDAMASGVQAIEGPYGHRFENAEHPGDYANACEFPSNAFASLWDQQYGKAAWQQNPLVYVIRFKVVSPR